MRFGLGFASTMLAAAVPAIAGASPINAHVSQSGLNFLRDRAVEMIPASIPLPAEKIPLWECEGEDASFELQEGRLALTIHKLELKLPENGTLRVELDATAAATGKAHFEKLYVCYGRETCDARVEARHLRATIDLSPSISAEGKPKFSVGKIDVQLEPEDLDIVLSNCPEDDIVNLIVDFVTDYGLKLGILIGQEIAKEMVGPEVEKLAAGFLSYQANAGTFAPELTFIDFNARLTNIDITTSALTVSGDLDLAPKFPRAACLTSDPGEPNVFPGPAPDLVSGNPADVAVSVNLGLIQDALYHVWRDGRMCLTPHTLEKDFDLDLDAIEHIGDMLPGFPPGTHFTFEAKVLEPPRVEGNVSSQAKLSVHVGKMAADLIATLPDGSHRRAKLELDASVSASLVMDPSINALALQVDGVKLDRMDVDDQLGLTELGFDFARVRTMLETVLLPHVLADVGQIPVTGPVFGGFEDLPIYVILKELKTTPAYVGVKANLFRAPLNDTEAPTTAIEQKPNGVVRPSEAKLIFGGTDKLVPTELLRYKVLVDGRPLAAEPTFVKVLKVGEAGKSQRVRVQVHAVDLAGNEDRAGQSVEVDVDGVPPVVNLTGQLRGTIDDLSPTLSWAATDDKTAKEALVARVTVTEIPARAGTGAEVEVSSRDLGAGHTSATLEGLQASKQYRVVLAVRDQAGNEGGATMIFSVSADASSGGCAVGDRSSGLLALAFVAAALVLASRRRRPRSA
jgi:hypothetical protein